jgi:hypothetical protein
MSISIVLIESMKVVDIPNDQQKKHDMRENT